MVVDGMDQGILLTGADQKIGFANAFSRHLFGMEMAGRSVSDLRTLVTSSAGAGSEEALKGEVLVLNVEHSRQTRCFLNVAPLSREDSENINLVWSFFELTEEMGSTRTFIEFSAELATMNLVLKKKNEEIAHRERFDGLTGVASRSSILELLAKALNFGSSHDQALSLLLVDVDLMNGINEQGWKIGDEVLVLVARITAKALGQDGTLGRFTGDQFLAVVPGADGEQARVLAEEIRTAIQKETTSRGNAVTVSVGVCDRRSHTDMEKMVAAAAQALSVGKAAGRNRVVAAG